MDIDHLNRKETRELLEKVKAKLTDFGSTARMDEACKNPKTLPLFEEIYKYTSDIESLPGLVETTVDSLRFIQNDVSTIKLTDGALKYFISSVKTHNPIAAVLANKWNDLEKQYPCLPEAYDRFLKSKKVVSSTDSEDDCTDDCGKVGCDHCIAGCENCMNPFAWAERNRR